MNKITYTKVDEAPALATYSLYPILKAILSTINIDIELKDISLSSRILSKFQEYHKIDISDELKYLENLVKDVDANIIKLPNISASLPQLTSAISELQKNGYSIPDYPTTLTSKEEKRIKNIYDSIKGSAVNPVLREGNSNRKSLPSVKEYAKTHPYPLKKWNNDSKTRISHMNEGDFFDNEKSVLLLNDDELKIVFKTKGEKDVILKDKIKVYKNDVFDTTFLDTNKLKEFYKQEIQSSKKDDVLLSLHLKATMMKVSDPILFGHMLEVYFDDLISKYSNLLKKANIDLRDGLSTLFRKIKSLNEQEQAKIKDCIENIFKSSSKVAMVNSDKGITNFHVPSDVIIDASIPAMIKNGGKMYDENGNEKETNAIIPDRTYASMYKAIVEDIKVNGALDPSNIASVSNIGLMAKKAQEYGSHDKTFEIQEDGIVYVINSKDEVLIEHNVKKSFIYRGTHTQNVAIDNWIKLAIKEQKDTNTDVIFWLDQNRSHDLILIDKINEYVKNNGIDFTHFKILKPQVAILESLKYIRSGKNIISATGNVLRDYLTDLFPILELGTSAKMLSSVPLLNGGILLETGAGGSAPKHVEQLIHQNHLRWDSLGEFMAMFLSLDTIAKKENNEDIKFFSTSFDLAIKDILFNDKLPKRGVDELDTRDSHFYFVYYLAKQLSKSSNEKIKNIFTKTFDLLDTNKEQILKELKQNNGKSVNIGGYYKLDDDLSSSIFRPSHTFNKIIDNII